MNHLSLFSGIGGLDLAAEWAGFRTVAFVERDAYCQAVLRKHWPGVPIFDDVRRVVADADGRLRYEQDDAVRAGRAPAGRGGSDGAHAIGVRELQPEGGERDERGRPGNVGIEVELVSGGFPCQPHSVAGKRGASADDRDLWPEFARVIRAFRPRWVVAENVPGLLYSESGRFFGRVLGDLADMGYSAGWGVWGAADVGALHRRERVFILGHAAEQGLPERGGAPLGRSAALKEPQRPGGADVADAERERGCGRYSQREDAEDARQSSRGAWAGTWESEPDVGRVAHGVPSRVDRLRALGNAVVPQQAYPLFKAIADFELQRGNHHG